MFKPIKIGEFLHRKKIPVKIDPDEEYSLVTVKLYHKGVVLREKKKGSLLGSNMYRISEGDFILSGIDARNGAFGIVPPELDGAIVTNDFWYFDVDEKKVKRDFFFWLTNTPLFLDACQKSSKGETQRIRLQKDLFYDFEFHFPPIEQQETFLSRFSKISQSLNQLSEESSSQSSILSQLRQSILQEAIEGKLTADWRKANPVRKGDPEYDAEALLAKIKAEKQKLIEEGKIRKEKPLPPIKKDEIPFELPKGWVWYQPLMLGQFSGGGTPSTNVKEFWGGTIPWITPKDMKTDEIHSSELFITQKGVDNSNAVLLPENTLIFVVRSGILKRMIPISLTKVKGTINQDLKSWSLVLPEMANFLKININGNEKRILRDVVKKGMTVESFNFELFKQYPLPLPPLAEQSIVVDRVEHLLSIVDELEKQTNERKDQTDQLLQAVLREAFEGKSTKSDKKQKELEKCLQM